MWNVQVIGARAHGAGEERQTWRIARSAEWHGKLYRRLDNSSGSKIMNSMRNSRQVYDSSAGS